MAFKNIELAIMMEYSVIPDISVVLELWISEFGVVLKCLFKYQNKPKANEKLESKMSLAAQLSGGYIPILYHLVESIHCCSTKLWKI